MFLSTDVPVGNERCCNATGVPTVQRTIVTFAGMYVSFGLPFCFKKRPTVSPLMCRVTGRCKNSFTAGIGVCRSV